MKCIFFMFVMFVLVVCNIFVWIFVLDSDIVDSGKCVLEEFVRLLLVMEWVCVGDILWIVCDVGEMLIFLVFNVVIIYELMLYIVFNDGSIYYLFIGCIQVVYCMLQEIVNELIIKFVLIYCELWVMVNINQVLGNMVFVGGVVCNLLVVLIFVVNNMEQVIFGVGGILLVGDVCCVVFMCEDLEGCYYVYFFDFSQLMKIGLEGCKFLVMQCGDIVFVFKLMVGDCIEGVDVYLNQLLFFVKFIGVGVSYIVNNDC